MEKEIIEEITEEIIERKNPICVVSKDIFGEYAVRDIQTNSGWSGNPYGDGYALVPDEWVEDIRATRGFCDIELNDEGTEIISFTAREIPEIPHVDPEIQPSTTERLAALESAMLEMLGVTAE